MEPDKSDNLLVGVGQSLTGAQSLQKCHYLLKEVRRTLGWEFLSLGRRTTRPCSPKLPKLRFCFQSLMPVSLSKTSIRSHPWFGSHQRLTHHMLISNFFQEVRRKLVIEQTRTTLSHGWEHLLKYFNLHENKMWTNIKHIRHRIHLGERVTFNTCLQT